MKTDKELESLAKPIVEIYHNIEHDLLLKIASFFKLDEEVTIKNSLDWYFSKLEEMGALNKESIKILSKYSGKAEKEIKKALKDAGFGSISEERLETLNKKDVTSMTWDKLLSSKVINNAINTSFTDTKDIFKMINTKALESSKTAYMNALNQARLEISTGIYDYNTAITRAIEKMVDNGISGASYMKKDGTIYNMSLESVVRRDMLTAIYQTFNTGTIEIAKEIDADYVEVSSHLGARLGDGKNPISNHFAWQGKVYKIEGTTKEYDNLYEKTGYGDIVGLGGVNCRHKMRPFIPGIDKPMTKKYSYEENKKRVELQNRQRACERKIRKMRTNQDIAKQLGDSEEYQKWKKKEQEFLPRYNKFLKDNNLHRDYARERVVDKEKIGLSSNAINTLEKHQPPIILEQIDTNSDSINNTINKYEKIIKDDKIENAIVITKTGKVYQCFGNATNVWPDVDLGDELIEAIVTHNHPISESNFSFSSADLNLFEKYKLSKLRGVDDKYTYELNSKKQPVLSIPDDYALKEYGYEHLMAIQYAIDNNIYYMRWKNERT